ncbi:PAS domain S-box protein [Parasediminibacterium sp. JCM 36343]|uniref:PAS domain S-box protein n=1 Tax=Parasediminibacterium sp. JCM 36343 TaxID=3374279 RepID=UPI00397CEA52
MLEKERLLAVQEYLKIDFTKHAGFQDIVDLASELCEKPIALITLLGESINWLKVRTGVDVEAMPRETSFCQYGIQQNDLSIVPDATKDARFANNPLVKSNPHLRFYAGAPLILSNGLRLGTLCLFDLKPSNLTPLQQKSLTVLSRQVTTLMELEMSEKKLLQQLDETDAKNESLSKIAQLQSHQIRQPLTNIMGLVNLIKYKQFQVDDAWVKMFIEATNSFDNTIKSIVSESIGVKDLKAIHFSRIVEEIEDYAILMLDESGYIENWNKGSEKMKGYKAKEIIGKNFSIFYTREDRENGKSSFLIEKAKTTGNAQDEGWRVRKDGSTFWARVTITAIKGYDGEVIGFTKITRDLTALKNANDSIVFLKNDLSNQTFANKPL